MVAGNVMTIRHAAGRLSADDVAGIMAEALAWSLPRLVVLDLRRTSETTTAALARLVLLRGRLLKAGRDLRLVGLTGQAYALYETSRLSGLLPRGEEQES